MKTNKIHKRLAKIEAMISDLTERYSKGAPQIREALQETKSAFDRVKDAVSSQLSSEKAELAPVKQKKAGAKKTVVKTPTSATAKKRAQIKKAVKKEMPSGKTPSVPVKTATHTSG